jgi:hypothetical protein
VAPFTRAWALMNVADEASDALARATDKRAGHRPDDIDAIGGLLAFPQAKQSYYAAGTYVSLDDQQDRAQSEALSAINLFPHGRPEERSFSDEAGAHANLPWPGSTPARSTARTKPWLRFSHWSPNGVSAASSPVRSAFTMPYVAGTTPAPQWPAASGRRSSRSAAHQQRRSPPDQRQPLRLPSSSCTPL